MSVLSEVMRIAESSVCLVEAESASDPIQNSQVDEHLPDSESLLSQTFPADRILNLTIEMMKYQPPERGFGTIIYLKKQRKSA